MCNPSGYRHLGLNHPHPLFFHSSRNFSLITRRGRNVTPVENDVFNEFYSHVDYLAGKYFYVDYKFEVLRGYLISYISQGALIPMPLEEFQSEFQLLHVPLKLQELRHISGRMSYNMLFTPLTPGELRLLRDDVIVNLGASLIGDIINSNMLRNFYDFERDATLLALFNSFMFIGAHCDTILGNRARFVSAIKSLYSTGSLTLGAMVVDRKKNLSSLTQHGVCGVNVNHLFGRKKFIMSFVGSASNLPFVAGSKWTTFELMGEFVTTSQLFLTLYRLRGYVSQLSYLFDENSGKDVMSDLNPYNSSANLFGKK